MTQSCAGICLTAEEMALQALLKKHPVLFLSFTVLHTQSQQWGRARYIQIKNSTEECGSRENFSTTNQENLLCKTK